MRNIREKIVWGLVFLLAFLIMACGGIIINNGHAEAAVPSPTLDDLYQVISPYMMKSDFPIDLFEFECVRIDLNTEVVPSGNVVDGEFIFPALPTSLDLVFLYDGYHLVPAHWHWTDADRIYIAFDMSDIGQLDGVTGLYIFLFAYNTEAIE